MSLYKLELNIKEIVKVLEAVPKNRKKKSFECKSHQISLLPLGKQEDFKEQMAFFRYGKTFNPRPWDIICIQLL